MRKIVVVGVLVLLASACGGEDEPSCGGTELGGACWYKGALGESCTQVCASRGGYDAATASWAGSPAPGDRGNAANCAALAAALSTHPFQPSVDNINGLDDFGCLEEPGKSRTELVSVAATTESGANAVAARFCACQR